MGQRERKRGVVWPIAGVIERTLGLSEPCVVRMDGRWVICGWMEWGIGCWGWEIEMGMARPGSLGRDAYVLTNVCRLR